MRGARCARRRSRRRQRRRRRRRPRSTMDCAETSSRLTFTFSPISSSHFAFPSLLFRSSALFFFASFAFSRKTRFFCPRVSHCRLSSSHVYILSCLRRCTLDVIFLVCFILLPPRCPYRFVPLFSFLIRFYHRVGRARKSRKFWSKFLRVLFHHCASVCFILETHDVIGTTSIMGSQSFSRYDVCI